MDQTLQTFFGWFRSLVEAVWRWLAHPEEASFYSFVAANWKTILLVIAVTAMIADYVIYLFRWQPYKVWRSWLQRRTRPGVLPPPPIPRTAYPNPPGAELPLPPEDGAGIPGDAPDAEISETDFGPVYEGPDVPYADHGYAPYARTPAAEPMPPGWRESPEETPEPPRQPGLLGSLRSALNADTEEPSHLRYQAPPPPVAKEEAYGAPYIPPQWQDPNPAPVPRTHEPGDQPYTRRRRSRG